MIRDITVGQYYPVASPIHRLDPRVKLAGTIIYIVSLFTFQSFVGYAVATLFLFTLIRLSKVPFRYMIKGLKPILFLLIFTAVMNVFWTPGTELLSFWGLTVTYEGIRSGLFMVIRLVFLILGSSLMTFTTTPNELTDAIEKAFRPLNRIHIPVHEFAMMMSLALRFIPILLEEADKIIKAQTARGADFDSGSLWRRARAMVSILVPLLISATRRSKELAMAMDARCYHGGEGRTKMKPLKYCGMDRIAYLLLVIYFAVIVLVSRLFYL